MDLTALWVERIRQDLEGTRFAIELAARVHVAVLAGTLTIGAGAVLAGLAGQLDVRLAAFAGSLACVGFILQLRALKELARQWDVARAKAIHSTESLIASQGEHDHDDD